MGSSEARSLPRRRVVVISPMAALQSPTTAGGVLLSRIVDSHLGAGALVTVLTPSMRASLSELDRTSPTTTTRYLGRPRDHRGLHRAVLTVAHRSVPSIQRRDQNLPWIPLVVDLLVDPQLRRLLRDADVIDLQWEEYGRLSGLLRRLAPRATLLCTFHDVNSQRWEREAERAAEGRPARRALRALDRARRTERRVGRSLDRAFVLSEKDEQLLRACAPTVPITVVRPPLVAPDTPLADASTRPPVVGFVAHLRRHENRDAALRLAERIWPAVHAAAPEARLVIVGGGLEDEPARRLRAVPGVELTGFIEDLEAAYARFRVTVSPLDRGAGVKFKVVESIVRGLPTITTPIGAEGIDPSLFAAVEETDDALAASALAALLDDTAARSARDRAERARSLYGVETFRAEHQRAVDRAVQRHEGPGR